MESIWAVATETSSKEGYLSLSCGSVIPVLGMQTTQRDSQQKEAPVRGVSAVLQLKEEKWGQGHVYV